MDKVYSSKNRDDCKQSDMSPQYGDRLGENTPNYNQVAPKFRLKIFS